VGLPIGRDDVERAAAVIAGRVRRTPTLSSRTLGPDVFLKAELLQRTGSFKPRGVLTKLESLTPEEKARGVIAISAGNHAQAVAWAAAEEGLDALVVMWRGASETKIAATRGYGASVDLEASTPGEAFTRLDASRVWGQTMAVNAASRRVMERCGLRYVRTFFDEWPEPIEGSDAGDVEYALTRAEWERGR